MLLCYYIILYSFDFCLLIYFQVIILITVFDTNGFAEIMLLPLYCKLLWICHCYAQMNIFQMYFIKLLLGNIYVISQ